MFDYTTITDRLRISVGAKTVIQPVWLTLGLRAKPSHFPQWLCNQKDEHLKSINKPPYRDQGPAAVSRGEVIKI